MCFLLWLPNEVCETYYFCSVSYYYFFYYSSVFRPKFCPAMEIDIVQRRNFMFGRLLDDHAQLCIQLFFFQLEAHKVLFEGTIRVKFFTISLFPCRGSIFGMMLYHHAMVCIYQFLFQPEAHMVQNEGPHKGEIFILRH